MAGKGAVARPPPSTGLTAEKKGPGLVRCHNVLLSWLEILFRAITTAMETGPHPAHFSECYGRVIQCTYNHRR